MPAASMARAHGAAEGVDFADDLPLAHAADGRIAAHLGDGFEVVGQQGGVRSQARRGQRRLHAGVPAANDQDVEIGNELANVMHR